MALAGTAAAAPMMSGPRWLPWLHVFGCHRYTALPTSSSPPLPLSAAAGTCRKVVLAMAVSLFGLLAVMTIKGLVGIAPHTSEPATCNTPDHGYQCSISYSHSWGQYSPFYSVPSPRNSAAVPPTCRLTFAQILSRHGARDPTAGKTRVYNDTMLQIQSTVTDYGPDYEFIANYTYALGADQLTIFGQDEMIQSGIKFYKRYRDLARNTVPFVRSSGQERVVESAQNWMQGFHTSALVDGSKAAFPYPMVVIPEDGKTNSSLYHGLCTAFESGRHSAMSDAAQAEWASVFAAAIAARLNANLPGMNMTASEVILIMDLCPFNTVASPLTNVSALSPWCTLFTPEEWESYDYYESLGKWYGYGPGNPLGPTQGVGWTNELIARLTSTPVQDHTSTNATLDADAATFPLGRALYADFSHDNDMTAVLGALGLYNSSSIVLSNTTRPAGGPESMGGYAASWTVPFAARIYVEKMACDDRAKEELVRVLVNDRVVPLDQCGADAWGRCYLSGFVESLAFARSGGLWDACFE